MNNMGIPALTNISILILHRSSIMRPYEYEYYTFPPLPLPGPGVEVHFSI
jgi:hypothetical protein